MKHPFFHDKDLDSSNWSPTNCGSVDAFRVPGGSLYQWIFLVPLIGGRWYISPQLAVYTTYIPLIVLAYWVIIYHWSHLLRNQKQLLTLWTNPRLESSHTWISGTTIRGSRRCGAEFWQLWKFFAFLRDLFGMVMVKVALSGRLPSLELT